MAIVPTVLNGRYNEAFLDVLPGQDGDGTQHTADMLAVASYRRLTRDMIAAGLGPLVPSNGYSCYRTLDDQRHMRALGLTTIPVGKSIHGETLAVDYAGVPFGSTRHDWLKANAGRYGWYQPAWAKQNGSLPESWHWEYDYRLDTQPGGPTPPPIPEEEDDMFEQGDRLLLQNVENLLARGSFSGAGVRGDVGAVHSAVMGLTALVDQRTTAILSNIKDETGYVLTIADELRALRRDLGLPPL